MYKFCYFLFQFFYNMIINLRNLSRPKKVDMLNTNFLFINLIFILFLFKPPDAPVQVF